MGKNLGPGGKNRRKGKNMTSAHKREIRFREDYEDYGLVEKMLGDCRADVLCSDGTNRICHIRGKFRKRVWIAAGDLVLISLREFEDEKADIVYKYNPDEAVVLRQNGEVSFKDNRASALLETDPMNHGEDDNELVIDISNI
jgi:translation initiation factor 1A